MVNASTEQLAKVRKLVATFAKQQGFSDEQIQDIRLAVDEACTNIIKHAYQYDDSKEFEINIESRDNQLWISILDNGQPFDPSSYKKPDIEDQIRKKKRGGVGVYLIQKLMDKVEYHSSGGKNEIRMLKEV